MVEPIPARPPIVDISRLDERRTEITDQLMNAATGFGFFYITGHSIPQELIDACFHEAEGLFALPQEDKDKFPKIKWETADVLGYKVNSLADGALRETWMQSYEAHERMKAAWPSKEDLPTFRENGLALMKAMHLVAMQLLSCFASSLGLPPDHFDKVVDISTDENRSMLQYQHYLPTQRRSWTPGTNRVTAHTDESLLTLLIPNPGSVGLELAAGKDGKAVQGQENGYLRVDKWVPCPQIPDTIVVNVGDPLEMVSEGKLRSNWHRVRMPHAHEPQGVRQSVAYFVWPDMHAPIQGMSGKGSTTTMAEYMKQKGKIFSEGFSPDVDKYRKAQKFAFGMPQVAAEA